jgi:hypothetical protein
MSNEQNLMDIIDLVIRFAVQIQSRINGESVNPGRGPAEVSALGYSNFASHPVRGAV